MAWMTVEQVKDQLNISDSAYDTSIENAIPRVENDIRSICNHNFKQQFWLSISVGETVADYSSDHDMLEVGRVIERTNYFTHGTYIKDIDTYNAEITLSSAALQDASYLWLTIPISVYLTEAKMVWYQVANSNTTDAEARLLKSKTVGPISKTYTNEQIDSIYGYPVRMLNSLPKYNLLY